MKIQIRHFDRVLLINLEDVVNNADLIQVSGFINSVAARVSHVVLDLHRAQLDAAAAATLQRLRKQYAKGRLRLLTVATAIADAEFRALGPAVDSIGSAESERIMQIFREDAELAELRAQIARNQTELASLVGERALPAFEEHSHQLRHLVKELSAEIQRLVTGGEALTLPTGDDPLAVRVGEAKRRTLDVVWGRGNWDAEPGPAPVKEI